MSSHFKLHMETFSYFFGWFYVLVTNFLISRQNKRPKINPKMWKQWAGIAILYMSYLLQKQSFIIKYK